MQKNELRRSRQAYDFGANLRVIGEQLILAVSIGPGFDYTYIVA